MKATVTITTRPAKVEIDQVHPLVRRRGVHRLLCSFAGPHKMSAFYREVGCLLNPIERRENTVFFTLLDEHLEVVIAIGKRCDVTIQQMSDNQEFEEWNLVVVGDAPPWQPK